MVEKKEEVLDTHLPEEPDKNATLSEKERLQEGMGCRS
jgi:hypothetical protein